MATATRPDRIALAGDRRRAVDAAKAAVRARLALPPKLTLSEWSDRYRILSSESSAQPGPWRTEVVPYMREIMDTISGRDYTDVTIVKSSQTAGTEGAINNAVGYFIDQEPSPILVIQPNVKPMAEAWAKDRLAPMLRDTPKLRGKVKDARARNSGNTTLHKTFPGGYVSAIGANSASGLASRPIRVVLADELDRWKDSAGTEGDPLSLAEARTITYRHRKKIVKVTTLGNEGESRGEQEWTASDQRHYYMPCPHCQHMQVLEWRDSNGTPGIVQGRGAFRLVWERDGDGDDAVHKPETTVYVCNDCGCTIDESHKPAMLAAGEWRKHNPSSDRAGFHISGLLSPWVRWREIAAKWLKAKGDDEQRKTFFNTILGLLYQQEGEAPEASDIERRVYPYRAEVPAGVGLLTLACDVQGDRLEVEVRGWGDKEESWQIWLERIYGDPDQPDVWESLQALLDRVWTHESGQAMRVAVAMIDANYKTDAVYRFVRPRQARRVYAIRGADNAKAPLSRASRANADGVKLWTVSPTLFKDTLMSRLKKTHPGPGYLHFGRTSRAPTITDYFPQFAAEKRVVTFPNGVPHVEYKNPGKKRNEAIDLYCYGLAALRSMALSARTAAEKRGRAAEDASGGRMTADEITARQLQQQDEADEPAPPLPAPTPAPVPATRAPARRPGSSWINKWR